MILLLVKYSAAVFLSTKVGSFNLFFNEKLNEKKVKRIVFFFWILQFIKSLIVVFSVCVFLCGNLTKVDLRNATVLMKFAMNILGGKNWKTVEKRERNSDYLHSLVYCWKIIMHLACSWSLQLLKSLLSYFPTDGYFN